MLFAQLNHCLLFLYTFVCLVEPKYQLLQRTLHRGEHHLKSGLVNRFLVLQDDAELIQADGQMLPALLERLPVDRERAQVLGARNPRDLEEAVVRRPAGHLERLERVRLQQRGRPARRLPDRQVDLQVAQLLAAEQPEVRLAEVAALVPDQPQPGERRERVWVDVL